ncbi:MAG TPA: AMP-binding protein, partial [Myxococcota bacterium]
MTPTESFRAARQVLLDNAADLEKARAQFLWPSLTSFNWARDWFDVMARDNPRDALVVVSESGAAERVSFAAMADRSQRVARYLADAGVQRGDRVLLMLPNVVPLWETMLATMRLGAVLIPATAQLTPDDVDDRIARGDVKHVITDAAGASKVRDPTRLKVKLVHGSFAGFAPFQDAYAARADAPFVDTQAGDPLLLYFTSGTTAKPKLVLHTHESYPVGHLSTMYWIGLREGDVHQNISSPGWAKHAWSSVFAPWNAGATVLVRDQPKFSPAVTLQTLEEHAVTTLC